MGVVPSLISVVLNGGTCKYRTSWYIEPLHVVCMLLPFYRCVGGWYVLELNNVYPWPHGSHLICHFDYSVSLDRSSCQSALSPSLTSETLGPGAIALPRTSPTRKLNSRPLPYSLFITHHRKWRGGYCTNHKPRPRIPFRSTSCITVSQIILSLNIL